MYRIRRRTRPSIDNDKMREQELRIISNAVARQNLGFEEPYSKMIKRTIYSIISDCAKHSAIFCTNKKNKIHQILSEF